jgi:hypothetical protein
LHDLDDGHSFPRDFARFGITHVNTLSTLNTFLFENDVAVIDLADGALSTECVTVTATDAPALSKCDFRLPILSFRIVTPPAPQRTALQENDRSNTWPVVQTVSHDVEDGAGL